jgi:hypothetical protein
MKNRICGLKLWIQSPSFARASFSARLSCRLCLASLPFLFFFGFFEAEAGAFAALVGPDVDGLGGSGSEVFLDFDCDMKKSADALIGFFRSSSRTKADRAKGDLESLAFLSDRVTEDFGTLVEVS